jgi:hypothetical protein
MTRKGPKGARSVDGHQPNWSPPLSLWPSSRPLPIKPNPLSTTLPLTHPSRAPHPSQSSLPLIFVFSSFSLYYYPIPRPTPLSQHLSQHHAGRVQAYPKGCTLASRRAPQSLQLALQPAPSQEPRARRGLHLIHVRATCRGERSKSVYFLSFPLPPSRYLPESLPLRSLKRHCRTMSGRRKRSRMRLP